MVFLRTEEIYVAFKNRYPLQNRKGNIGIFRKKIFFLIKYIRLSHCKPVIENTVKFRREILKKNFQKNTAIQKPSSRIL